MTISELYEAKSEFILNHAELLEDVGSPLTAIEVFVDFLANKIYLRDESK